MESSFLEDLLKREVDQNQVNALVGSLENQLTTPRSTPTPSAVIKSVNISKNVLYNNLAPLSNAQSPATQNGIRNVSSVATPMQNNGQIEYKNICSIGQSIAQDGHSLPMSLSNSRANMGLMNNVSSQVSIAPKITNTVNIAPRLGTNIMITPRQAQIFMAQRFGSNSLINNNLISQMPGNIQVIPRVPTGAQIPIPPVMNTQIHNIRTVDPNNLNDVRIRMNSPVNPTSLTQIKTSNPVSCQMSYRFRPPSSNEGNAAPATSVASNLQNNTANITIMKESVKRLKEFFQNLINLACAPNQPPEIGKMVKELVHNLMQCRVTEEEFIEKLQKTLKSDPQPSLVHFLKKTLPHLRETIKKQQMQQVNAKSQQLQQQQQQQQQQHQLQQQQPPPQQNSPKLSLRPNVPDMKNLQLSSIISGGQAVAPQQFILGKNLTLQEQQMLQKQLLQHGRILIASSGQVTPGIRTIINQTTQPTANGMMNRQMMSPLVVAGREKPRNTHYSSAIGADDDINDVTCMAGVNLMEESQKILATGAEFISTQTHSVQDTPLLLPEELRASVERIAKKHGLTEISPDYYTILSHAVENRLRCLMERLVVCCLHRNNPHKDEVRYEIISDVRSQLNVFEDIDEVERRHRESREREMLMRVAKSRSKAEDPEQVRLKEKAKQLQQEEEEVNRKRAANRTALDAIGGPRKKRKLDEALESLQSTSDQGGKPSGPTGSSSNNTLQTSRSRRRITLKDMQFVLETEKDTCKSLILYRSYLR
ncbi:transcription initiation factor TFIID subunit 4-like [Hydra vulgaris]|uniref:Transcription initiation factor TFIID subunit 4-like n=1 Tax=Hydra vulgaris TaxID=6087 RepID=A0ABM4DNM5_HYDVU